MTHLQLTPDEPPPGTPEDPGDAPEMDAPGADELDEMRLERDEIERAADEGMVASSEDTTGIGNEPDPGRPPAGDP
jgi:hypothetical protein